MITGVDLLQAESVSHIVGKVIGALYQGMIEAGMQPEAALRVINDGFAMLIQAAVSSK